ncbi:MAG: DUF1735 domain-containing protein [Bacteroidia bacterium]|nr:DUF1735 domain-containing protein [Bacteroidia bacterium]
MKNKITLYVSFLAAVLLFGACLKDNVGDYWPDGVAGKMYAQIPSYTLQKQGLQAAAGDVPFTFAVNIATDAPPTEDITLTIAADAASVTQYNTDHSTTYKPYPNITVTTATVVIAKGTRTGTVTGKVFGANAVNACDKYLAAISITSAKTASGKDVAIASNMKSYLLELLISNAYAGKYQCDGYRIRPGNPTEPVSMLETFNTVDCTKQNVVQKNGFGNYTAFDIYIEITTTPVVVGGTTCYKVNATPIDPATGVATGGMWPVWTGDASKKPADLTINYYNPVTKTFVLNCYYSSSAGNRIMYEVLVKQ